MYNKQEEKRRKKKTILMLQTLAHCKISPSTQTKI